MVEDVKRGKKRGIGMTMTHSGQPVRQVDFHAHALGFRISHALICSARRCFGFQVFWGNVRRYRVFTSMYTIFLLELFST